VFGRKSCLLRVLVTSILLSRQCHAFSNFLPSISSTSQTVLVNAIESPSREDDDDDEEQQEDDIDWDKLAQSEPARTDIPIFLAAHARKEEANDRFAAVLDDAHSSLLACVEALLTTVAEVHNVQRDRLEAMEADIKHNLVCNDEARAQMQVRLQESANAAQGLFAKLLQRVTEPIQMTTARMQEGMLPEQDDGESTSK